MWSSGVREKAERHCNAESNSVCSSWRLHVLYSRPYQYTSTHMVTEGVSLGHSQIPRNVAFTVSAKWRLARCRPPPTIVKEATLLCTTTTATTVTTYGGVTHAAVVVQLKTQPPAAARRVWSGGTAAATATVAFPKYARLYCEIRTVALRNTHDHIPNYARPLSKHTRACFRTASQCAFDHCSVPLAAWKLWEAAGPASQP